MNILFYMLAAFNFVGSIAARVNGDRDACYFYSLTSIIFLALGRVEALYNKIKEPK